MTIHPLFKRYFNISIWYILAGIVIILFFSAAEFKLSLEYNKSFDKFADNFIANKQNYTEIKITDDAINCLDKSDNQYIYFNCRNYFYNALDLYSKCLGAVVIMLLCLNINLFSDENREFINVLPIKKQNIYLLRALSTLAVAIILDIIIAVIVLYFFRYNQYIQLAVMSKISKIDFNWINDFYGIKRFAADFVHRSLLIVAGAGFLSFLNTIFSKPRLVFILGFISFFVTLAGFKGIAIFADYFSLFNKNAFYTFCSDIENYSLSPISLILLTIFFTIAGAFLYKKEKNENRQGFFMFYPLRYLCYALGSFFGGFSFFAMINLKILSHIPKINMLTSIIIVIFGAFMAFFIIKKLIDTLE